MIAVATKSHVSSTLIDRLQHHARTRPDGRAYVFLGDRGAEAGALTFAGLDARARAIAARLAPLTRPGDRGLLVFSPGLAFLEAFFGCLYAGVVAVPVVPPRHDRLRHATAGIVADCQPRVALTTTFLHARVRDAIDGSLDTAGITWVRVDEPAAVHGEAAPISPLRHHDLALLQYTSGSTSAPKGVMVRHANLVANLEMAGAAFGVSPESTYVSWVPLHHDMGLILNALASAHAGSCCVLMAPVTFVQRPLAWLRAIHDYRADVAGGPNFAFDHCVRRFRADHAQGLDLSGWRVAFNGAEPVHADTIERFVRTFAPYGFAPEAIRPAYGMAEATVLISCGRRGEPLVTRHLDRGALGAHRIVPAAGRDAHVIVSCGRPVDGTDAAVVDPHRATRAARDEVGEIWVRGPHVAAGYWHKPAETAATFHARIAGDDGPEWLRTGDLGWIDAAGEVYVTGRLKDVIVIRGTNVYPEDVERTVEASDPALRPHAGAAFSVEDEHGEERLVVVQEIDRDAGHRPDLDAIVAAVRAAVVREHELTIHAVVLVPSGGVPRTSSGKIQRRLSRDRWRAGVLPLFDGETAGSADGAGAMAGAGAHRERRGDAP